MTESKKVFSKPEGSWVALITPFTEDDRIDMDGFATLVDFHVKNGSDGVVFMGSTGEATSLDIEEKKEIISAMADYCKGKIPAMFGVTCSTTKQTVALAQHVEARGGEGVLMVVRPYIIPPQKAIFDLFATVARSVSIGVTLYNNPGRVIANIDPSTIEMLGEMDNVLAIKEASPSITQLMGAVQAAGNKMNVLCCDSPKFGLILPLMSMGGHGTSNVTGNIIPAEMARLSRPWETKEHVFEARETFFKYKPLMEAAYSASNPIAIKAAVGLLGLPAGKPRLPLTPLDNVKLEKMKKMIETFQLREKYGL